MSQLIVTDKDNRLFLEKVIEFGANHDLLPLTRRQAMVQESLEIQVALCERYGFNQANLSESMQAARLAARLTSLVVEKESESNLIQAAAFLQHQPIQQPVLELLSRLEQSVARVSQILQSATSYMKVDFGQDEKSGYFVKICQVDRPGIWFEWGQASAVSPLQRRLLFLLENLKNAEDERRWYREAAALEAELKVCKDFLPWDSLRKQSRAKPGHIEDDLSSRSEVIEWGPGTLIATLIVTAVYGGTCFREGGGELIVLEDGTKILSQGIAVGTTFPENHLPFLADNLHYSDRFKKRARGKFLEYLEIRQLKDPKAKECLWQIWQRAMDNLLQVPPGGSLKRLNLTAWSEKIHLETTGEKLHRAFGGQVMKADRKWSRRPQVKKNIVEKIRDLGVDPPRINVSATLRHVNWDRLAEPEGRELIEIVPPFILMPFLPATPKWVILVTENWEKQGSRFSLKDREQFVKQVIQRASCDFWEHCPEKNRNQLLQVSAEARQIIKNDYFFQLWEKRGKQQKT